jgi:glycosyltransferase involved in cell wall biosynthesis
VHRLSAVVITLDEESSLARTLDSVAWCDEIVVMDSGSTDRTVEIAQSYPNCRVITQPFLGYGPQKCKAVAAASHDWILSIDADEVLDERLQASLQEWRRSGTDEPAGYYVRRQLHFMGRQFAHGNESRNKVLRLFDRRRGSFDDAPIHERVGIPGPAGSLQGRMIHYTYRDLGEYFAKFNRYTTLMASQLRDRGRRASMAGIVLRMPATFFVYYFLRGNWMNGFPGFVWSLLAANYRTVKYLKLYELGIAEDGARQASNRR